MSTEGVPPIKTAFINPATNKPLRLDGDVLVGDDGEKFPVIAGVPRFCEVDNYTSSFGRQWNIFQTTQIDGEGVHSSPSATRLFEETQWKPEELEGLDILEVGSGAGRFSRVLLEHTNSRLFSIDYSTAVEANLRNNGKVGKDRLVLAQASIYDMPFPDNRFDKVLCLGVLQHTPDFAKSVQALIDKAKPGGEIVVDFYPIRGFWTKIHAKYLLRPITKRMSQDKLLKMVDRNVDWLMAASRFLKRAKLGALRRFLPLANFIDLLPAELTAEQLREWVVLDTFDMFSPEFDNPQRIPAVAEMFDRAGANVSFAGYVDCGFGKSAVVRGIKRQEGSPASSSA